MTDLGCRVTLGRTGIQVSRLGVGAAYGVSTRACLRAFDAGVNYFYWGSTRTVEMGLALREIARHSRDQLVVVMQTYARRGLGARWSVERGLRTLGLDQVDILLLGWHDDPPRESLVEVASRLREQGRARFVAISSHVRPRFQAYVASGVFDVLHVRYNAAHRGAETDVFPCLPPEGGPGIVTYTNTRWGDLLAPKHMPTGMSPPSATDCYRFALTNPHVHVALCGPKNDQEMDAALAALKSGPLDEGELARMHRIGDHVHGIRSLMTVLS